MTSINDLPVLTALDDPDFGASFKWTEEFFKSGEAGLMKASWGAPVAVRHKDLLALGAHPLAGHQPLESQLGALPASVAQRDGALAKFIGAGTFHLQPPELTANKAMITRGLTPKSVANFSDEFGATVQRLIAQSRQRGAIDFIKDFAKPAMTSFWGTNLGFSSDEVGEAMRLAAVLMNAFSMAPTEDQLQLAYQAAQGWLETMPKLIARAERQGSFPIVAGLTAAFDAINPEHRVADKFALISQGLFDGFHTMGSGFAATVHGMLEGGLQPVAHRESPSLLAKGLVSEAFRIHGAVAMTTREALADFDYNGVQIPRGTSIHMIWTCANLDPEVFSDPFTYVLDRKNASRKLSFGGGPYMCAGRHLVGSLSERLVTEFVQANVEVVAAGACKWRAGSTIHELTEFPVILN